MEEWRDVIGYEGLYQVSNLGRVKHLKITHKNRFGECTKQEHIVGYKGSNGYMYINLCKGNKMHTVTIHSLVAKAFIPNPNGYDCINHKDESHDNNRVDNLEWCTKNTIIAMALWLKENEKFIAEGKYEDAVAYAMAAEFRMGWVAHKKKEKGGQL